ncbi:hypothetical protein CFC21_021039 [Triticum aestivum]|uniref:NB-ARC domain-containing protein n=2 Tax=Triticum aestivum TaxID=4565 RepID=A0A3B6BY43_WHEAT|nr:hypothetical protein CFC21_021039 [Triticum aestivum]
MSQAIVQRACAKLSSALVDETVARLNFTADLRDTLEAFDAIQPMLDKAEMQPFMDSKVSFWLQRACNAAYKTIDTVDELQDARPQPTATMTRMLPRLAIMKNAMAIQVQETKKLVMWVQEYSRELSGYIADKTIIFQKVIEERKTGPVFEEAMVLKRGSDKQRIIAALLSTEPNITQEHITILPIFGFPGSGKTTLAQMVFNDTHSLLGYDFRAWVHVSPHFNFHTIGKFIICQVSGRGQEEISHSSSDVEGMESIMKRLHKLLDGKKVLLVLDELWEEDPIQLQLLKSMLTFLGDKMDVIVTTCNQAVARKTCTVEPYRLKLLSDETCWEIIKKSIRFEAGEEELEKIGRKITSKCWGVPSIARQYAGMLDSSRDANKWKRTMQMNIWSWGVPSALSSLELCYMSMPPDLRLCFDNYCAVFPTGHNIVKDDLVQQWIALHLVEQSDILSAAQIAEKHITRLQDMAFLQTAELDHMTRMLPCIPTTKNAMAMKLVLMKTKIMDIEDKYHRYSLFEESEDAAFKKIIDGRKTWPNQPFLEEALVFERGSNKQRIVAVLLSAKHITREPITTILPIFGLAGIGKTTLAQMLFNDTHFLPGYDFRVWVQVWPELDFHTVGESIIHRITGATGEQEINDDHGSQMGIESIMEHLHQVLNGKVLLVLDDLWEEDPIRLGELKSMLTSLEDKMDVIVTTCNQAIARNICTVEPYKLKPLSDDTCWEIIKKSIHFKKEDKEEAEKVGREMASKCRRVPSAAQAFAGLQASSQDVRKREDAMLDSTFLLPI